MQGIVGWETQRQIHFVVHVWYMYLYMSGVRAAAPHTQTMHLHTHLHLGHFTFRAFIFMCIYNGSLQSV